MGIKSQLPDPLPVEPPAFLSLERQRLWRQTWRDEKRPMARDAELVLIRQAQLAADAFPATAQK